MKENSNTNKAPKILTKKPILSISSSPLSFSEEEAFESLNTTPETDIDLNSIDEINELQNIPVEVEQLNFLLAIKNIQEINFTQFKAESLLRIYYKLVKENQDQDIIDIIENAYIEKKIGNIKYRKFKTSGDKQIGFSQGRLVNKIAEDFKEVQKNKFHYTWLEKKSSEERRNKAEEICEYVGTNLMNFFLKENSPKIRLLKNNDDVSLVIKYLYNYQDFANINPKEINFLKLKGKAEFYVANFLLADVDNNKNNFGIRKIGANQYLARIDHGKIFSYKAIQKDSDENQAQKIFNSDDILGAADSRYNNEFNFDIVKKHVFGKDKIFNTQLNFSNNTDLEFHNQVLEITNKMPYYTSMLEKIIDKSINNLKSAYGEDIFLDEKVKENLSQRLNININECNEETFKNTILSNMTKLNNVLIMQSEQYIAQDKENLITPENKRKFEDTKYSVQQIKKKTQGLIGI
jgi:hypothetical protein